MHLYRWLTGIIAVPILIFIIGPGPRWLFSLLVFSVSLIGIKEFYRMTSPELPKFVGWAAYGLTLMLFAAVSLRQILLAPVVLTLWAFVPMAYFMFTHPSPGEHWTASMGKAVLGPVYVALPLALLVMLDLIPKGNLWIFFLLAVVFAGDTAALYSGKLLGKHKLYESISPNKTWEGAIGGLLGSVLAALIFVRFIGLHQTDAAFFILVIALSVSGQIGDLTESMFKRNHGLKDSGRILPGHGGILDRIDGLLFATPILYLYVSLFVV